MQEEEERNVREVERKNEVGEGWEKTWRRRGERRELDERVGARREGCRGCKKPWEGGGGRCPNAVLDRSKTDLPPFKLAREATSDRTHGGTGFDGPARSAAASQMGFTDLHPTLCVESPTRHHTHGVSRGPTLFIPPLTICCSKERDRRKGSKGEREGEGKTRPVPSTISIEARTSTMASRPPQPRSESTSSLARSSLLRALDPSSRRSPVASTSQLPSPMEEGTTGAGRKSPKVGFRGHASGARRAEGGGAYDPGASAPLLMGGGSGGGSGGMSPDLGRKGSRSPTFPLRRRTSNTPSTHSASASTPNPNSNGNRRRSTSLASLKGFFRPGSPESDRTVTAGGGKRKSFGIGGGSGSSTTTIAEGAASASSPPLSSSLSRSRSVTKRDSLPGPGGKKKRNSLVFGILGSPRLGSYDESEEGRGRGGGLGFVDVDEENEIRWEMEEKMRVRERLDELVSRVLFQVRPLLLPHICLFAAD